MLKKGWSWWDYTWQHSLKRVDYSHLTEDAFTIDLVSNASGQLLPAKTLSCFKNFLPEPLNLSPKCYWGKFTFLTRNDQTFQNNNTWSQVSTIQLPILWKLWTCPFNRATITQKILSQSKCLEERTKVRFTSQLQNRVLHSLVRTWINFWNKYRIVDRYRTSQASICFCHCPHTLSHDIHRLDWVQYY